MHTGDAEDLAALQAQVDAFHRRQTAIVVHVQIDDIEDFVAAGRCGFFHFQYHVATHHQRCQGLLGGLLGIGMAGDLAASQHNNVVADFQHFFQLMADENDADAFFQQRMHDLEQAAGFLRRQHRRRLVQDQNIGLTIEGFDNLDALLNADRQIGDQRIGVDIKSVLLRQLENFAPGAVAPQEGTGNAFVSQHHVFSHGQHINQLKVLMHHADAEFDGVFGSRDFDRLPIDQDLALVGFVQAVDHVHQGALAGAVFAQQSQNFAFAQREVDIVVGENAGEAFGDAAHFEDGSDFGHGEAFRLVGLRDA